MKSLILTLSVFVSATAFANPFSGFVGDYAPASPPQVTMSSGMKYCDWMGFREMTSLSISLQNGLFVADLNSSLDGSNMSSHTDFLEYSHSGDFGVTSTAKITGDATNAKYQVVNMSSGQVLETSGWAISKSGAVYHLRLVQSRNDSGAAGSCTYDVDLAKR